MKITKKITSIVLALLLAVSAFAGLAITANAAALPDGTFTLNVHKGSVAKTTDEPDAGESKIGNTAFGGEGGLTGTTADEPANFKGLKDVTFSIYKVGDFGATDNPTTVGEAQAKVTSDAIAATATQATDVNGLASFADLEKGLYLVVEDKNSLPASVNTAAAPFLVWLPTTNVNGDGWLTTVEVYPKNLTTLGGAVLEKKIDTAAYVASKIDVAPIFKIVEKNSDSTTTDVVTGITLASKDNADGSTGTVSTDDRYNTVKVGVSGGKIAVTGLPVGNYAFVETGAATVDGTEYPQNNNEVPFSVALGTSRTVAVTASESYSYKDADGNTQTTALAFGEAMNNATYAQDAAYTNLTLTLDNSADVTISKTVTSDANRTTGINGKSVNIGDTVYWNISVAIPANIDKYTNYVVTDTLDSALEDINDGENYDVNKITFSGANIENLTKDTDYTITANGRAITFEIKKFDANWTAGTLVIQIPTVINSTALAVTTTPTGPDDDKAIDNQATLAYTNDVKIDSKESDHPYVYTAGLNIVKKSQDTATPLNDVEFTLYRGNGTSKTEIKVLKGADGYYYPSTDNSASSTVVTSKVDDVDGVIKVKGLANGSYTLVETKTNSGYQLRTDEIGYTVTDTSFATSTTIENVKQPDLPLTGGMGTILFTVAGLALVGGSAFFFIRSRKSRKEEI